MATPLVSDDLWGVVAPLLPTESPKLKGGRPRVPDRICLAGILFVLRSGIPWGMLPPEMGSGSGVTCWRRLRDWQAAGVWARLHRALLGRLDRGMTAVEAGAMEPAAPNALANGARSYVAVVESGLVAARHAEFEERLEAVEAAHGPRRAA